MDPVRMVSAVQAGGLAVARAGRENLDAEVANCDGWTVEDLVRHLGRVYRSVATIVSTRSQVIVPPQDTPSGPRGMDSLPWFEESLDLIVHSLQGIDVDELVWTWAGILPATFYFRRMAHETAIHAVDATAQTGACFEIDSELGADGVDEYLERVLPFTLRRWTRELPGGSLHLHRTDGDGEWLVAFGDGGFELSREHAKGDAALKGTGDALFLAIWNRLDVDELDSFGDADLARAWAALAP